MTTEQISEQHRKLAEHAITVVQRATEWKHHGFGLIQVTVTPAHRVNIWAPELRTIGRDDGAWHTHRARIHATVLAGSVFNTYVGTGTVDKHGSLVDVWEVPHRGHGELRRTHAATVAVGARKQVDAGESYVVERGEGHWTEPGPAGAVTSALMMDMVDSTAAVFLPQGMRPARAFDSSIGAGLLSDIRERALVMLRAVLEGIEQES